MNMKTLMNNGWRFLKLACGSTLADAMAADGWQDVDLPHDWLIWQADDLYESADAWYRREVAFGNGCMPEVCMIRFDGVYMDCDVLLNGELICSHPYGYTAFDADLSGKLHAGSNEVLVHIRHRSPNSRWYSGSGIFRDVHLVTLPADHLIPDSFAVREEPQADAWSVVIDAETKGTDHVPFSVEAVDSHGNVVARAHAYSQDGTVSAALTIPQAEAWSPDHPVLYTLRYQYGTESGSFRIGLRMLRFDPNEGLFINGCHVKLKGVCLHHDLGALGAAFHEKAAARQLRVMKEMGVNALRTSHNPPAERMLDLCDEMGILVIDEAFDMWERPKTTYDYARFFHEWEERDVASWVRRDRCHASVIMWSIGNEIYDMHADLRGTEVCTLLMEQVRRHDPAGHAVVTFGCNYMPWEGGQRCAEVVKVPGYNYGENLYESHHRDHPEWVIYGSETASVLSSRGIYHFPIGQSVMSESDWQCSALGNSNTSWGASDLRKIIVDDLKCGFSLGQFIWSGIDYIGEPTPYHTRSCYFGQTDTACFPKDSFYLFRSLWQDLPVLHIGVSWDWNPGQLIDVPVMTNLPRVELMLNGSSLGILDADRNDPEKCMPVWKVPFVSGELIARGYDADGNMVLEDRQVTPEDPDHFVLASEDESLPADGADMTFVTVQAADRHGNPVHNARSRVRVSVKGGGCLLGTDNGDSTDTDGYKSASRRLFGGKLLLMIGSTGEQEDIRICVSGNDIPDAFLTLKVLPAERKKGTSRILRIETDACSRPEPIRKIEIIPAGDRHLTPEHSSCTFRIRTYPENAASQAIRFLVTNAAGIPVPYATVEENGRELTVRASGDGTFYLRAETGEHEAHADVISQIELWAEGIGQPALNPYEFVSAGLYDLHEGNIGTGNEKGIAFDRVGESMVGFSRVDFGKDGSDTLFLPVFALNGDPYEIEMFDGDPRRDGKLIELLHYEKPSIWNVYQEEVYHLPVRLTGEHTICFRMRHKVHLKGFRFERQNRVNRVMHATEADEIYGDSFRKDGDAVRSIGNNVTLIFRDMDFGAFREADLAITGSTPLNVNTISVRMTARDGETVTEAANFSAAGGDTQRFRVRIPGDICTVSFVFLPGSQFDFESFRFIFPEK